MLVLFGECSCGGTNLKILSFRVEKSRQKGFHHQVKPPEAAPGIIFVVFSLWVSVAPGDPSLSSSRLQGAGPEISTFCILQKLSRTMPILYMLILGVPAFTIQPEERTGKK